ncbi:MAG: hypothetical protein Q8P64_07175 [Deltaproteobacteria bacterium]|nr:hypothetical protein [Deltaproteobacteria bacterium]
MEKRVEPPNRNTVPQEQLHHRSQELDAINRIMEEIVCDTNDIFTIITGYCQLTLLCMKYGEPWKEYIEKIEEAIKRTGELNLKLLSIRTLSLRSGLSE